MLFKVEDICKHYGGKTVLDAVSFQVDRGDVVSIVGPSGVGKTTLLRIIAGLEKPDSGTLLFEIPPSTKQPVIMVFQDYLLFPNMTIGENISFGLKARKLSARETRDRVMSLLSYFKLEEKVSHYPDELSAGQKQRVAIARAMAVNPSVLLLDEPFANLDRNLKMETAEFIRSTQKEFNQTTISVTHDLEEAFVMSDKVGVMLDGKLVQYGPPNELYFNPATEESARFLGPVNVIPSDMAREMGYTKETSNGAVFVRPEALRLTPDRDGRGTILKSGFAGHYIKHTVQLNGTRLVAYGLPRDHMRGGISESGRSMAMSPGDSVQVTILNHFSTKGDPS